jgi:hypothetical protein
MITHAHTTTREQSIQHNALVDTKLSNLSFEL